MNLKKTEFWKRKRKAENQAIKAGKKNPKGELVICEGCGRDTRNLNMLCDECTPKDEALIEPVLDDDEEIRETKYHPY